MVQSTQNIDKDAAIKSLENRGFYIQHNINDDFLLQILSGAKTGLLTKTMWPLVDQAYSYRSLNTDLIYKAAM